MNEMAHFQESRVDPAAGQPLDFIDALVGGDEGEPIVLGEPDSPAAQALSDAATQLAAQVSIASYDQASATAATV